MSFADDSGRVDAWGAGSAANGRDDVQGPGTWSQKGASDNFDGHNADFGYVHCIDVFILLGPF